MNELTTLNSAIVSNVVTPPPPISLTWLIKHPGRRCRGVRTELFFPAGLNDVDDETSEPPYPTPEAKLLCDRCVVRAECLQYALDAGESFGIWGGQTGYQRSLLTKKIDRKTCPGCSSPDVIIERNDEICLACGLSWSLF